MAFGMRVDSRRWDTGEDHASLLSQHTNLAVAAALSAAVHAHATHAGGHVDVVHDVALVVDDVEHGHAPPAR